ncbi:YajG family lipoprotein [Colwelliaceae bacterium BS250]
MYKAIAVILSVLLVSACANEPTAITLNPKLTINKQVVYQQLTAKLSVTDIRASNHIVEVLSNNKKSKLIGTTTSLKHVLDHQFSQELGFQGLAIIDSGDIKLNFSVERARTYVNQDVLDYRANTIIKLKVKVENPAQTLSKTFTLRATSRGPLTADIDELQQDFNIQLAKLITQVIEDEQLQNFIKG